MKTITLLAVLVFFNPLSQSLAATYYIDYASGSDTNDGATKSTPWKRAPGMVGFSGAYRHFPGDFFIFKGGVTWPAATMPLTIQNSGGPGTIDSYTVDPTWFSGPGWSQPIFDGGGTTGFLIMGSSKGYFTINGFKLQNGGTSRTNIGDKAIQCFDCHHVTVSNSTFVTYTWIAIYFVTNVSNRTTQSIYIHHNDISNCTMGVVVATSAVNSIVDDVVIYNNTFHDFSSKIGNGAHGDGIHTWGQKGDETQYLTNLKIYNNLFYGSFRQSFGSRAGMTAFIYVEGPTTGALIYNNVGSYTDPPTAQLFESMISINGEPGRGGGHQIYNNSFQGTSPGMAAGMTFYYSPKTIIKNNAFRGMNQIYYARDAATANTATVDYDCVNFTGPSVANWPEGTQRNWANWQANGWDLHGINADPLFVSNSDLHLQAASRCRIAGTNLSTVFTTDKDGHPRPATGRWAMGAYGLLSVAPAARTDFRIGTRP